MLLTISNKEINNVLMHITVSIKNIFSGNIQRTKSFKNLKSLRAVSCLNSFKYILYFLFYISKYGIPISNNKKKVLFAKTKTVQKRINIKK